MKLQVHGKYSSCKYLQIASVPITFAPPGFEPEPFGKLPDDANHALCCPTPRKLKTDVADTK